jgi:hypothetical protein
MGQIMAKKAYTITAILCEDVRSEIGNKHTIIGTYTGDILLKEFPATFRIAMFSVLKFAKPGKYNCAVKLFFHDGHLADGEIVAEVKEPDENVIFVLPSGLLNASEEGEFRVDMSLNGTKWETVASTTVKLEQ